MARLKPNVCQLGFIILYNNVAATASVMSLLKSCKSDSWETKLALYDSISESVLLYLVEIWGCNLSNVIERGQLRFLKLLLHLPRNTPDCFVRIETGRIHTGFKIFKRVLGWWLRLLEMPDCRLPKLCYLRLKELDGSCNIPYNWVSSLRHCLSSIGAEDLWAGQSVVVTREEFRGLLDSFGNNLLSKDIESVLNSRYNPRYRHLSDLNLEKFT
uniref:Uncharacterized protein n=1 Tax=Rhodnius prolixus TaxID=13249 RepID=T1HQJ9_RHOPR